MVLPVIPHCPIQVGMTSFSSMVPRTYAHHITYRWTLSHRTPHPLDEEWSRPPSRRALAWHLFQKGGNPQGPPPAIHSLKILSPSRNRAKISNIRERGCPLSKEWSHQSARLDIRTTTRRRSPHRPPRKATTVRRIDRVSHRATGLCFDVSSARGNQARRRYGRPKCMLAPFLPYPHHRKQLHSTTVDPQIQ